MGAFATVSFAGMTALVVWPFATASYAGMPLVTSDGLVLGTLCVIDRQPRVLNTRQRDALQDLATIVSAMLENIRTHAEATQMSQLLNQAFDEILVLHPGELRIQYASAGALKNLGYDFDEIQQKSLCELSANYPIGKLEALSRHASEGDRSHLGFEVQLTRKNGSTYHAQVRATVSASVVAPQLMLLANEVPGYGESANHIGEMILYEQVADLVNRHHFENKLTKSISAVNAHEYPFALISLGIDRLTEIRSRLGNNAANQVLIEVAQRIRQSLYPADMVAYLGDDQFAVLVEHIHNARNIIRIIDKIELALAAPFQWKTHLVPLPASIGSVMFTGGSETACELITRVSAVAAQSAPIDSDGSLAAVR